MRARVGNHRRDDTALAYAGIVVYYSFCYIILSSRNEHVIEGVPSLKRD